MVVSAKARDDTSQWSQSQENEARAHRRPREDGRNTLVRDGSPNRSNPNRWGNCAAVGRRALHFGDVTEPCNKVLNLRHYVEQRSQTERA